MTANIYQDILGSWHARKPGEEWRDFGVGYWGRRTAHFWAGETP